MPQLTEQDRTELIRLLQAGEAIPSHWRGKLFPGGSQSVEIGKEYRLEYAGKMKREQPLAETPAAPWQLVRRFAEDRPHADGWRNLLVWGDNLSDAITKAGVADKPVFPVCVEQELESWLLADETKIALYLSTDAHAYSVKRTSKPDREPNPKSVMMNHFKSARGWRYDDRIHAIKILGAGATDLKKMRRSPSFARFEAKLLTPV